MRLRPPPIGEVSMVRALVAEKVNVARVHLVKANAVRGRGGPTRQGGGVLVGGGGGGVLG